MPECSKRVILTVATGVFGFASFICLCIAVSTDYWLYALERYTEDHSGTNWTYKVTTTGLWRKCVEHERDMDTKAKNCSYINYFKSQDKDGLGPTDAIILSLRRSTLFPLISLFILLAGQVIYVMSHCDRNRKVLTFVSGIVFVIAGLLILIGIILYIGAITEEAGNKSKPNMDGPTFEYWYGASFVFTVTSFSTAEFTGVLSVYLYISRHKHSYRKKAERLHQNQSHSSFNQLQRHSRSVVSLSNVTESDQRKATESSTYGTRSPIHVRSNGRANGCIGGMGMGAFGPSPVAGDSANFLISQQNIPANASTSNLPAYDQSLFVDTRRPEQPTPYQPVMDQCWSYAPMSQLTKPSSTLSMATHHQWAGADMHPSASTTDYSNYNDYMEDNEDGNCNESTPRMSVLSGMKVTKDSSRHNLASGSVLQNNPSNSEWYTPSHGAMLSTPDSNVYRRTTPV